jgi:HK97 family phage prohead protease
MNKYADVIRKILDASTRELEPSAGDQGAREMVVRGINLNDRTVEAVVSTHDPDRYEEIVDPRAYKKWLKTFMQNPVLMPGHQYTRADGKPAQIGTWLNLSVEEGGLVGTAWFDEDETSDAWWRKYSNPDPKKRAKGFSVGFLAHAWEMRDFDMKEGPRKRLRVFTEVELLEISAVPIPANRAALSRAASAGMGATVPGELLEIQSDHDELRSLIATEIAKALDADLNGRLAGLIENVVETYQRLQVQGHHHDDDGSPNPGTKSGTADLERSLRTLAGEG